MVDKPAGLLTISTDREKEKTAYHALTDYVRKGATKSRKRIFIVHRLDRETSGVLLMAKTEEAKRMLQEQWWQTEKHYLAVAHGHFNHMEDTISSYLAENAACRVYTTANAAAGKLARTAYRVLREVRGMSLLDITLLTGRKHQIRVHLAGIGHPIVGDKRYGQQDNARRLALHAWSLSFPHPADGNRLLVRSEPPALFRPFLASPLSAGEAEDPHSGSIP